MEILRDSPEPHAFGRYRVRVDWNTTHRPANSRQFMFRVTDTRNGKPITSVYWCEVDEVHIVGKSTREIAAMLLRRDHKSHLFDYLSTPEYP